MRKHRTKFKTLAKTVCVLLVLSVLSVFAFGLTSAYAVAPYDGGDGDGWNLIKSSRYMVGFGLTSQADQAFTVSDAATAISAINMSFTTGNLPTAASDIRLTIPSGINMTWDSTDTTATIGGTASAKVSTTVSFESSNKILVLNVTSNIANDESLELSDVKFANFTVYTNTSYKLTMDINNDAVVDATDSKLKTIFRSGDATNAYAGGLGDGWARARSAIFTLTSPPKPISSSVAKGNPPVAAWDFNEGSGATTYDEVGSSDGTISGASWKNEPECHTGKCLNYDGTDDVTTVTQNATINLTGKSGYTVVAWIRPESDGEADVGQIFNKGTNTYLRVEQESSGTVKIKASFDLDTTDATFTTTLTIPTLTWSHLALTYNDDSDDEIELYINGVYKTASTNGVSSPATDTNNLLIGGITTANFKGSIDQVAIYNYARSAGQIKSDFNSLSSTPSSSSTTLGGRKNDQNDGLVGHWKMDESTWTADSADVVDSSGAGNTGTVKGSGTDPVAGKYGKAGSFNGTSDYVTRADTSSLDGMSELSIEAWINPDTLDGNYRGIVVKQNCYYFYTIDNKLKIFLYTSTISSSHQGTSINLTAGTWNHVAVSYNKTNIRLYINGNETVINFGGGSIANTANDLNIGNYTGGFFDGLIDDVRIYNKARSSAQIAADYRTGPPPVAHYKMDDNVTGAAQTIKDTTGSNNGTTYGSNIDCTKPGKYGNGCKFDGSSDYVDAGDSPFDITGNITVSAWVKYAVNPTSLRYNGIIGKSNNDLKAFVLQSYSTTGKLEFVVGDSSNWFEANGTTVLQPNQWYYAVGVYNGTNLLFYLNGVLEGSTSFSGLIGTNNYNVVIGKNLDGTNPYFNGLIDDVRIYNYARTPAQIQQDMLGREDWSGGGSQVMAAPRADSGTVGWWDFDEANGSSALDKSSMSNTLTMTAGATGVNTSAYQMWDLSNRKYGKSSIEFDGDDYLTRADDADFDFTASEDFSVTGWFKHNTIAAEQHIINKYSTAAAGGYKVWMDADGDIGFGVDDDTTWTPDDSALTTSKNYDDNAWHQFIGVKTGTSRLDLYIDGVLVASDTSITATGTLVNAAALYIGVNSDGTSNDWDDSYLDSIKIYRSAISASDAKTAFNRNSALNLGYQSGADPSTSLESSLVGNPPVGHWSFDERSGATVPDRSGNNNDGTWAGTGTHYVSQGKLGPAGKFNGSDDYVSIGNIGSIRSIGIWAKPSSTSQNILDLNGSAYISMSAGTVSATGFTSPTIYIDGIATTTFPDTNWHQIYVTTGTTITASATNIGKISTNYYSGLLDEAKIYNYARTQQQIAYDYNKGLPVSWWKFNEGSGNTAYDYMKRNNGTLSSGGSGSNSTSQDMWDGGASGKYNKSLEFDGTNDTVTIGNLGSVGNSISAWVKPSTTTQKILELSGTSYIEISAGTVSATGFTSPTIYVDGFAKTSFPDTNWHLITVVDTTAVNASATNIGKQSTNYFTGQLDDVRVYNYALSAAQVKKVFNEGASVRFGPNAGQP